MSENTRKKTSTEIVNQAMAYGADLAGIAALSDIKSSPSHVMYSQIPPYETVSREDGVTHKLTWPETGRSVIVIAIAHPEEEPELDWFRPGFSGATMGNRKLIEITRHLRRWLEENTGTCCRELPYHIGDGGLFVKDMAVLAGLGCIGRNNLLVTPIFGPRVRIRGIVTDLPLTGASPPEFDPCRDCPMPCRTACPQEAFEEPVFSGQTFQTDRLPAQEGVYDRTRCSSQMKIDNDSMEISSAGDGKIVRYCRLCEFSCPVGRPNFDPSNKKETNGRSDGKW